jgi:cytochrome c-type biogenesis protein CcmH/NrfG
MRMRQSIAELERQFVEDAVDDRERAEMRRRHAERRTAARNREKRHKRGSLRFVLLIIVLIGTAVLVTVAMFQTLYLVMG